MAKLSADKTYVTVEKGDTLSAIAKKYGNGKTYQQLASINNIPDPDKIYIDQIIYLDKSGASSTTTEKASNKAVITHFGLQSNADNTLFAVWTWDHQKNYKQKSTKKHTTTENYSYQWYYATGDGVWFVGSKSTTTDKQTTWSIPQNATKVRFRVKPVSKKFTKNKKETTYFTADWTDYKEFNVGKQMPPETPSVPSVKIEKYKLTASLENIEGKADKIEFQIVKNDSKVFKSGSASIKTTSASYSCTVDAGAEYKVRCRAIKGELKSDWTNYSSNITTIPSAPSKIISIKAKSETKVLLDWDNVKNATNYVIEYTTKSGYFDSSNNVSSMTIDATAAGHAEITGLTPGEEYFFRVKATNEKGDSGWCPIKSIIIGKVPAAPTTWSSTTTTVGSEDLNFYWVHNSEDGSLQTYAQVKIRVNGKTIGTYTLDDSNKNLQIFKNDDDYEVLTYKPLTEDEKEKGKNNSCYINTSAFTDGSKLQWSVRTAGILVDSAGKPKYGDWSVERQVDIYAPPNLELLLNDTNPDETTILTSYPLHIEAIPSPDTQRPIGYHVNIIAKEAYDTIDNIGNERKISKGESVYSKYFDINGRLKLDLTAGDVNLDNSISYTVICTVSMDSGLSASASSEFRVSWYDVEFSIDAEIALDEATASAYIRPYCERGETTRYIVTRSSGLYTQTTDVIEGYVYGTEVKGAVTDTGEQVYYGTTVDGENVYFCNVEETFIVPGVTLSVYRREYDGSFVELATGLSNENYTTITDPHPSLDYARYRVVAIFNETGSVSFYDVPGVPVNEKAAIIQWDEEWSNFDSTEESELEQPVWSGSMLKIPYNIDVSDSNDKDIEIVEYIGRKHAVAYYGTHLGVKSNWSMEIPADDKELLYALRRLQNWMGDVYVREPSGSGYWATVSVSFSQTHCEVTIPVTLSIVRVEGGI